MDSHGEAAKRRIVVDNLHGDVELTEQEWRVVNTATFQRLRWLKQLGMGHLVYPNATHSRFAHSLGVFAIMRRIVRKLDDRTPKPKDSDVENLRLAALLHDVGHYPYSHLMERVDAVQLTEEEVQKDGKRTLSAALETYPDHETLGRHILETQKDIQEAIGGAERAKEIGSLFSRAEGTDPQLSKLIHSSLDMDRLDYLLRDARASGVPYGEIDLNYLLNNIRISPSGVLGVEYKALAAAEHFLLARLFMHRVVYYHKSIFGFEEACRQLLRRVRDAGKYEMPSDGAAVVKLAMGSGLLSFTDDYVDQIIRRAAADGDRVISGLARCITNRRAPKLLAEVSGLQKKGDDFHAGNLFRTRCKAELPALATKYGLPVGLFLLCGPKPIKVEERGPLFTRDEAKKLQPEEREELIKVFQPGGNEPSSIVEIDRSLTKHLSDHPFGIHRLYVVDDDQDAAKRLPELRKAAQQWTKPG
jgi:HD superfamily phosphohydrolase